MTLESLNLNHFSELLYEATSYSLLSDLKLDDAVCGLRLYWTYLIFLPIAIGLLEVNAVIYTVLQGNTPDCVFLTR